MNMNLDNRVLLAKLKAKNREIRMLRLALRAFTQGPESESDNVEDQDEDVEMGDDAHSASGGDAEEDMESEDEAQPAWDEDGLYRCGRCSWEIADGWCQYCLRVYPQLDEPDEPHPDSNSHIPLPGDDTFYDTVRSYQATAPRGNTPVPEVDPSLLRPEMIPLGYEHRMEEYKSLLSRGASPLMCEAFDLQFTHQGGITFKMDEDLIMEWARDEDRLRNCTSWKVYLGREIRREPEDDDGSIYIDEVLDEALLHSVPANGQCWETVETTPGQWITWPTTERSRRSYANTDSGEDEPVFFNGYEELSDNDEYDREADAVGRRQVAGGRWYTSSDDEDHMYGDEEDEDSTRGSGEGRDAGNTESDSFDSDFDSQEELSGDEAVLAYSEHS